MAEALQTQATESEECFPTPNATNIKDVYQIEEVIAKGGLGTVRRGVRVVDNLEVAIKNIPSGSVVYYLKPSGLGIQKIPSEIVFMQKARHVDGVIKFIEWFQDADNVFIVMELPTGAIDLFDYTDVTNISEETARIIFVKLVNILSKIKQVGIAHCDIKIENVLISMAEPSEPKIYLVDFGAARVISPERQLVHNMRGTRDIAAPEFIKNGAYCPKQYDVWTLGIFLLELTIDSENYTIPDLMYYTEIEFNEERCRNVSANCIELIKLCTKGNPDERPSLEQILKHGFCQ